jgi:hypothetical protein
MKANKNYKKDKSWSGRKTKKEWARLGKGATKADKELFKALCEYMDCLEDDDTVSFEVVTEICRLSHKGIIKLL